MDNKRSEMPASTGNSTKDGGKDSQQVIFGSSATSTTKESKSNNKIFIAGGLAIVVVMIIALVIGFFPLSKTGGSLTPTAIPAVVMETSTPVSTPTLVAIVPTVVPTTVLEKPVTTYPVTWKLETSKLQKEYSVVPASVNLKILSDLHDAVNYAFQPITKTSTITSVNIMQYVTITQTIEPEDLDKYASGKFLEREKKYLIINKEKHIVEFIAYDKDGDEAGDHNEFLYNCDSETNCHVGVITFFRKAYSYNLDTHNVTYLGFAKAHSDYVMKYDPTSGKWKLDQLNETDQDGKPLNP